MLCYILVVSIGLSILFNRNASSGPAWIIVAKDHEQIPAHGPRPGHVPFRHVRCAFRCPGLRQENGCLKYSWYVFQWHHPGSLHLQPQRQTARLHHHKRKKNCAASLWKTCTAVPPSMKPPVPTIWKSTTRSSPIVDKSEYQKLMSTSAGEDPLAFITIYNVSDMRYQPKR